MKRFFWTWLLSIPVMLTAQITESFEYDSLQHWMQYPEGCWKISSVNPVAGKGSLWHSFDNLTEGCDRISRSLQGLTPDSGNCIFQFRLKHGYAPSSTNKWGVFLFSDNDASAMKAGSPVNGYIVGVNMSGSDDFLKIWKVKQGSFTTLIESAYNWQTRVGTTLAPLIRVVREKTGIWELWVDSTASGNNFFSCGSKSDVEFSQAYHFGISYSYTSTKDRLLWLDDLSITGTFILDKNPPKIISLAAISDTSLVVDLSETANPRAGSWYIKNPLLKAESVLYESNQVKLNFVDPFPPDQTLWLKVDSLKDVSGNIQISDSFAFIYHPVLYGDVVINEIMADPSPVVGLPACEYVELFNHAIADISLSGWTLEVGTSHFRLDGITLKANSFGIICPKTCIAEMEKYGKCLALLSGSGSLSNAGSTVILRDPAGKTMSVVRYSDQWYGDPLKSDGGWSLEKKDPGLFCSGEENWTASLDDKGGTPGMPNSVVKQILDESAPYPLYVAPIGDSMLLLTFSETPDSLSAVSPLHYSLLPVNEKPVSIIQLEPEGTEFYLNFEKAFDTDVLYELRVEKEIPDCNGNVQTTGRSLSFALPGKADSLDIVFSEILYHPGEGGSEYLEVFQRSNKILELKGMEIATVDPYSGEIKSHAPISESSRLFFPGEYLVLCSSIEALETTHELLYPSRAIEIAGFPALSDEGGKAVILTPSLNILDEICWNDEMHHPMVSDPIGVSLERMSMDGASCDNTNWHSASSSSNYGTPGYENSQLSDTASDDTGIHLNPVIFTPDNDGRNDVVSIQLSLKEPGWMMNMRIFDASGRLVSYRVNNRLMGNQQEVFWDGANQNGLRCTNGIYIVHIALFHPTGKKMEKKLVCVIAGR